MLKFLIKKKDNAMGLRPEITFRTLKILNSYE